MSTKPLKMIFHVLLHIPVFHLTLISWFLNSTIPKSKFALPLLPSLISFLRRSSHANFTRDQPRLLLVHLRDVFNAGSNVKNNGVYYSSPAGANCYPLSLSMRGSSMEKYDIQVTAKVSVYMFLGETTTVRHASQTNGGAAVASAGV